MFDKLKAFIPLICALCALLAGLYIGYRFGVKRGLEDGYNNGYNAGYSAGYSAGYADKGAIQESSAVKTETKIEYIKIPYNGNDVQVTTPPPKVTVSVNGKKQEVNQKTETADLQVKTETDVKLKIPERRWSIGIGTDGHKATYMLKAPIKGAVGAWVAGGGRDNRIMGGVSVSF